MAKIIKSDGSEVEIKGRGKNSRLTVMQMSNAVGGHFELIPCRGTQKVWANEDGKRLGLPMNVVATEQYGSSLFRGDYLAGDILITEPGEVD